MFNSKIIKNEKENCYLLFIKKIDSIYLYINNNFMNIDISDMELDLIKEKYNFTLKNCIFKNIILKSLENNSYSLKENKNNIQISIYNDCISIKIIIDIKINKVIKYDDKEKYLNLLNIFFNEISIINEANNKEKLIKKKIKKNILNPKLYKLKEKCIKFNY